MKSVILSLLIFTSLVFNFNLGWARGNAEKRLRSEDSDQKSKIARVQESEPSIEGPFAQLLPDLWLMVFKYLDLKTLRREQTVSHRQHELVLRELVNRTVSPCTRTHPSLFEAVSNLPETLRLNLRDLNVRECVGINDQSLTLIKQLCPNLKSFKWVPIVEQADGNLSPNPFSHLPFQSITLRLRTLKGASEVARYMRQTPQLATYDFYPDGTQGNYPDATQQEIENLILQSFVQNPLIPNAPHHQTLKNLSFYPCSNYSGSLVAKIVQTQTMLKKLQIGRASSRWSRSIRPVLEALLPNPNDPLPAVQSLFIYKIKPKELRILADVLEKNPKILELELILHQADHFEALVQAISETPQVRHFNSIKKLRIVANWGTLELNAVLQSFPNLRVLDFKSENVGIHVMNEASSLERFILQGNPGHGKEAFIGHLDDFLKKATQLKTFSLRSLALEKQDFQEIGSVLKRHSNLQKIYLNPIFLDYFDELHLRDRRIQKKLTE
jgi:hypothetical protein